MGHTCRGFFTFVGKCLILLLKIYHAIMYILLIYSSICFLPFGPAVWKSAPGLNIIFNNSQHTIIYLFAAVSICATVIGVIGAISKNRVINLLFLCLATCCFVAAICSIKIGTFQISEQRFNDLGNNMRSVEWSETKLDEPGFVPNEATITWHKLQNSLGCCGLDSYRNWTNFKPAGLTIQNLPSSCCSLSYKRTFKGLEYCSISQVNGQIEEGSVYPTCLSRASIEASNPHLFVAVAFFQLHQAILNIIISRIGIKSK